MRKSNVDDHEWQECSPGQLGKFAKQSLAIRRRSRIVRSGGAMALLVLVFASGYAWLAGDSQRSGFFSSPSEPNYGGIYCSEVKDKASLFIAKQLDDATSRMIEEHIKDCPLCRTHLERMREGVAEKGSRRALFIAKKLSESECVLDRSHCGELRLDIVGVLASPHIHLSNRKNHACKEKSQSQDASSTLRGIVGAARPNGIYSAPSEY